MHIVINFPSSNSLNSSNVQIALFDSNNKTFYRVVTPPTSTVTVMNIFFCALYISNHYFPFQLIYRQLISYNLIEMFFELDNLQLLLSVYLLLSKRSYEIIIVAATEDRRKTPVDVIYDQSQKKCRHTRKHQRCDSDLLECFTQLCVRTVR